MQIDITNAQNYLSRYESKIELLKLNPHMGDPINAIKIFNEKEVDELMFLDIDASVNDKEPLCYGGGVKSVEHIKEVFESTNVDAVACGSMFVYQGPLKGVLISYPPYEKIQKLLGSK